MNDEGLSEPDRDPAGIHHVVVPGSLQPWFEFFCSAPPENVHRVNEDPDDPVALRERLLRVAPHTVVFHSNHISLTRDINVAEQLRRAGVRVIAQSPDCAAVGLDKFAMRACFARLGISMPPIPGAVPAPGPWVVKQRFGTEGKGSRIIDGAELAGVGEDEYAEGYVDGDEYSVVAYADRTHVVALPLVAKGRCRPDLLPPFMRPRLCPAVALERSLEARMLEITESIITATGCEGWIEVEFVVGADGDPLVLEINPRIPGTLRLGAMAAGIRVFDLPATAGMCGAVKPRALAVEIPWSGPSLLDPEGGMFATSRLTVSGRGLPEIGEKFRSLGLRLEEILGETSLV